MRNLRQQVEIQNKKIQALELENRRLREQKVIMMQYTLEVEKLFKKVKEINEI